MWKIILFLHMLFLSGCGGQFLWGHNDPLMQTNFDRESYDCEYKARMYSRATMTPSTSPGRPSLTSANTWGDSFADAIIERMGMAPEYKRCMESKGYYQVNK